MKGINMKAMMKEINMKAIKTDGTIIDMEAVVTAHEGHITVSIPKETDFSNIRQVELDMLGVIATTDDEGYLLLPRSMSGSNDYALCIFNRHKSDFIKEIRGSNIPVFGIKTQERCCLAVVSGMPYSYTLTVSLHEGEYRAVPVFEINGIQPYEDLRIEYFELSGDDANYSGMARRYRKYKLEQGELTPLCERIKTSKTLAYSTNSVLVRIRCGWKPAPAKIRHQTLENEPAMHVACDFDRVGDILDELKRQHVEQAEICLVGWNVKGHDGRWPQAFPVCEELGGEEKLRKLIKKAQDMGYQITCHTNSTDQYEIADIYDADNTRLDRNGKPVIDGSAWSGGEMEQLCPRVGFEQAKEILPEVAELGFKGTHYIDVLGIVPPRECYHPGHPVNYRQAVEYAAKIAALSRELFGGFSTEGVNDFIAPYTDYGLYICFSQKEDELCDKRVPFWQLVYHGYVLSNPYPETINPTFKDRKAQLKLIEYGGHPSYYFYSAFMSNGNNWMGSCDAICDTDEQLRSSVEKIKQGYEEYRVLANLQTAFMEKHEEVSENVYEVTYSNGTVIRIDYEKEDYEIIG